MPTVNALAGYPPVAPLVGVERARVVTLLEQADSTCAARRSAAAAAEVAGLIRKLGSELTVQMRAVSELRGLSTVDSIPAPLAILVRLVEILDEIASPDAGDADDGFNQDRFGSVPVNATAWAAATVEALCDGLGPHGFLPTCVDVVAGHYRQSLERHGAHQCAWELELHAAFALRLALGWAAPPSVSGASDALLKIGGHERIILEAIETINMVNGDADLTSLEGIETLAHLSVILDCLWMGLETNACLAKLSTCERKSLGHALFSGLRFSRGRDSASLPTSPLTALAPLLLETLDTLSAMPTIFPGIDEYSNMIIPLAVDAAGTAAIGLLGKVLVSPEVARVLSPHRISAALAGFIQAWPFSVRLGFAVRVVACTVLPSSCWFAGRNASKDHDLRRALAENNVPAECVRAAIRTLRCNGPSQPNRPLLFPLGRDAAEAMRSTARSCVIFGHLEFIVFAVHGVSADNFDIASFHLLRRKLRGDYDVNDDEVWEMTPEDRAPPAKKSLWLGLSSLRRGIRESCIAPRMSC